MNSFALKYSDNFLLMKSIITFFPYNMNKRKANNMKTEIFDVSISYDCINDLFEDN